MKRVVITACALLVLVTDVTAQVVQQSWQRYTVKNENFSVELPVNPSMSLSERRVGPGVDYRKEIVLGAYADGVVYMVYTLDNGGNKLSFKDFCKEVSSGRAWDRATEQTVKVNGAGGKQYVSANPLGGAVQLFSDYERLYRFQTVGAPPDDPRVKRFFESIVLSNKADGVRVSDGPFLNTGQLETNPDLKVFKSREVDRKALIVIKPEPRYTESAKREAVSGTVVLRALLHSDGSVIDIELISGLPRGLTEGAIDAAQKIKFIPALKDGKFVSVRVQLEYNFNLY